MRLDHRPMRHEGVFNKGGAYSFVVEHNLLLHQEAIRVCTKVVADWLANRPTASVIRILDLACGGTPVVTNGVMRQFVIHHFDYHGVDINADQIKSAKKFRFSPNVRATLTEGDCWQPAKLVHLPFDIVFVGLNSHHAVPEELQYFATQLNKIVTPDGLFLNYDLFRPTQYPYLRRPDRSDDGMQSLTLVPPETLQKAGFTPSHTTHHAGPNWRQDFLIPTIAIMKQNHCPKPMIDETITHIMEHDYPVSTAEMCAILKGAGFRAQTIPLSSESPLAPFFDVVAATL